MKYRDIQKIFNNLAVFREVSQDRILQLLRFDSCDDEISFVNDCYYSKFAHALVRANGGNWSGYIADLVLSSNNPHIDALAKSETVSKSLEERVELELGWIQQLLDLEWQEIKNALRYEDALCECNSYSNSDMWMPLETKKIDIKSLYKEMLSNISTEGFSIYRGSVMFRISDSGKIEKCPSPDKTKLTDLAEYKQEKLQIIKNIESLLRSLPSQNILLTGDAGTGKSSTIKAIANEYADRGLRIIEVKKNQISLIPHILEEISDLCLKFIIFIDDVSFECKDEAYANLKMLLEGSLVARAKNCIVCATSNRRHLVSEKFASREGDEIHVNDAIQEAVSLSERFGLRINFSSPSKNTYLEITKQLAEQANIDMSDEEIERSAERYALTCGGRSPRVARQFVEQLQAELH